MTRRMTATFALAACLLAAIGLAPPARAAEPVQVLKSRLPSGAPVPEGQLIRTAQGLALLGEDSLTPLEGGRPSVSWKKRQYVTPVAPGRHWLLAVEKPRTGGYAEPQKRGRLMVGDLDLADPLPATGIRTLHNAGWVVTAAEAADGTLTMVLWAKAPPIVSKPEYRIVTWSPTAGYLKNAEWPAAYSGIGPTPMIPNGQGGWGLLVRNDDEQACPRRARFAPILIDASLAVTGGKPACLPASFNPFTTEVVTAGQTPQGPVWFVSSLESGTHRLARIEQTPDRLVVKPVGTLPAGSIGSAAYDPATGDLVLAQKGAGGRLTRVAPDGAVTMLEAPAPSCGKAGGRSANVAFLEGRLYVTSIAADPAGACVDVWRY